ncbi:MAG: hypothetical protein K0Q72_4771 [Armatimonadetes bacterium]|nr:hypothetical protein [Armatimonadota bacterium]
MQQHLRHCPACSAQTDAEATLRPLLCDPAADRTEEAAAIARVQARWLESIPVPAASRVELVRPRPRGRGWWTASAVAGMAAVVVVVAVLTGPSRAVAQVQNAMSKVQCFHLRMEVEGIDIRYEAWGERNKATRVEEHDGDHVTLVVLDDGQKLRRYSPDEKVVRESATRLSSVFRDAAGFQASRMLSKAARGRLFDGQDWLGEAEAKEVAQVRRDGIIQRKINIDLKGGYFARMVIYAPVSSDRLIQANLYLDRDTPLEAPFARVFFDYPQRLDPKLFEWKLPGELPVRQTEEDLRLP